MNGGLIVDKPAGPTSHDVVARVRRAIGVRRIGHAGTLDPLATGVLVLLVGRATRLAQYLSVADKAYIADIRLGRATATYDAEERLADTMGEPLPLDIPSVTAHDLREALDAFRGTFLQRPPPFSAKKVAGTPAYVRARRQEAVELSPAEVTVRELTLLTYTDGLATVRVVVSSGFYVRSLAHDLGGRLGCGGHLEALRRTGSGALTEEQAVPLDVIEAEGTGSVARLVPMARLVEHLDTVTVTPHGARSVAHGRPLGPADLYRAASRHASLHGEGPIRILDEAGELLAIGRPAAGGLLRPAVVLM